MPQLKRSQQVHITSAEESTPHQFQLQTIGMRIRKSVADGYQISSATPSSNGQPTIATGGFKRVPLPSNVVVPPLLSNMTSSSRASSFEEWENNLDLRLERIDHGLQTQGFKKRNFESIDEEF